MITQPQQPLITNSDPLAMQWMTQGQMGYMPNAQFLTPADYGAFRTMPTAPMHTFAHQDPGFIQSYLIRNYGGPLGMPKYTFNTYNPAVNQQVYMANAHRSAWDSSVALGFNALTTGVGVGASLGLGFLPGAALGMGLSAVEDAVVNRTREMRAIQNMSMSKIVGGPDVNMSTGMGFNYLAARRMDSNIRMSAADDVLFKEGDYRNLISLGVEHGLFDYANNAAQYKDILKKLRGTMTTMMEVVGSTDFKDLVKEFKRMQTMGADISQFQSIARKENMFSRITGLTHSDMVNTYGQQGALIFSQNGLNNYQGSLQAMSNAATITMAQRTGLISAGMVARNGGVSGLAQSMTMQDAAAQKSLQDILLPYFMNDNMTGLDANADITDLMGRGGLQRSMSRHHRLNNITAFNNYSANKANVWGELVDKYGHDTLVGVAANVMGKSMGLGGMQATETGLRLQGYGAEEARMKANFLHSDTAREQAEREAYLRRKQRQEEYDLQNNPFKKLSRWVDRTLTSASESVFGGIVQGYGRFQYNRELDAAGMVNMGPIGGRNIGRTFDNPYTPNMSGSGELPALPPGAAIGRLSAKFESGKDGSSAVAWDVNGGTSYGRYQLSGRAGSMKEFVAFLRAKGKTELAEKFEQAAMRNGGSYNTGSKNGELADIWKAAVAEGGDLADGSLEHQFIEQSLYGGALNRMRKHTAIGKTGLSAELEDEMYRRIMESDALKEVLFSTAVQHGAGGATRIFRKSYSKGMSKQDFIKKIYENRSKRDEFETSTDKVYNSVKSRFEREGGIALKMAATEETTSNIAAKGNELFSTALLGASSDDVSSDSMGGYLVSSRDRVQDMAFFEGVSDRLLNYKADTLGQSAFKSMSTAAGKPLSGDINSIMQLARTNNVFTEDDFTSKEKFESKLRSFLSSQVGLSPEAVNKLMSDSRFVQSMAAIAADKGIAKGGSARDAIIRADSANSEKFLKALSRGTEWSEGALDKLVGTYAGNLSAEEKDAVRGGVSGKDGRVRNSAYLHLGALQYAESTAAYSGTEEAKKLRKFARDESESLLRTMGYTGNVDDLYTNGVLDMSKVSKALGDNAKSVEMARLGSLDMERGISDGTYTSDADRLAAINSNLADRSKYRRGSEHFAASTDMAMGPGAVQFARQRKLLEAAGIPREDLNDPNKIKAHLQRITDEGGGKSPAAKVLRDLLNSHQGAGHAPSVFSPAWGMMNTTGAKVKDSLSQEAIHEQGTSASALLGPGGSTGGTSGAVLQRVDAAIGRFERNIDKLVAHGAPKIRPPETN